MHHCTSADRDRTPNTGKTTNQPDKHIAIAEESFPQALNNIDTDRLAPCWCLSGNNIAQPRHQVHILRSDNPCVMPARKKLVAKVKR